MDYIHKYFAYIQRNGQFLLTFPNQCLLFGFARFNLSANELPQEPPGLVIRTLTNQKFILVPN